MINLTSSMLQKHFKSQGRGDRWSLVHSTQHRYMKILFINEKIQFSTFVCCLPKGFHFYLEVVKMLSIIRTPFVVFPRGIQCTYTFTIVFRRDLPVHHDTNTPIFLSFFSQAPLDCTTSVFHCRTPQQQLFWLLYSQEYLKSMKNRVVSPFTQA